jgi:hypothetical protein
MHAVTFERVKDGGNLFRRQYLELVLFDRWRLLDGRNVAAQGAVLDGAPQRCTKDTMGVADSAGG